MLFPPSPQFASKRTLFRYWQSFIPDAPNSDVTSLLSALIQDPVPKGRVLAAMVLAALLEGSRQYMTAVDDADRPPRASSFTPFSATLGAMVRELHRGLLLAVQLEGTSAALVQLLKCMAVLVANAPYSRLRKGYITRMAETAVSLLAHKGLAGKGGGGGRQGSCVLWKVHSCVWWGGCRADGESGGADVSGEDHGHIAARG